MTVLSTERVVLEDLGAIKFFAQDVHLEDSLKARRTHNLRKALLLGNLYKRRVKILFKTVDGLIKNVEATVWGVGEQFVMFRGGNTIPINSVTKVEF